MAAAGSLGSMGDRWYSVRENHLRVLKKLQKEIMGESFSRFNLGDLVVRAEELRAHFAKMEDAHVLYRQCMPLSSDVVCDKSRRSYLRVLAKVENQIRELEQTVSTSANWQIQWKRVGLARFSRRFSGRG